MIIPAICETALTTDRGEGNRNMRERSVCYDSLHDSLSELNRAEGIWLCEAFFLLRVEAVCCSVIQLTDSMHGKVFLRKYLSIYQSVRLSVTQEIPTRENNTAEFLSVVQGPASLLLRCAGSHTDIHSHIHTYMHT